MGRELIDSGRVQCKWEFDVVGADIAKLEQENARLGVALSDAYGVLGKTKTALEQLQAQYDALKYEVGWFKRQLFGQKSKKRLDLDRDEQLNLLAGLGVKEPPSREDVRTQTVTYERRAKVRDAAVAESGLRFGSEVPVQTIEVTDPAIEAIPQAEREVIGEKVSYRQTHTRAVVETFWRWCREQCHRPELLPKSPMAKASSYAMERRSGLEVFLDAPQGQISEK